MLAKKEQVGVQTARILRNNLNLFQNPIKYGQTNRIDLDILRKRVL